MSIDKPPLCLNCNRSLDAEFKFCPSCGQENRTKLSFKDLMADFLEELFTYDSKIFKSILPLMVEPGRLTLEFNAGKRKQYIPPLRMYIVASIVFFLMFSFSSPGEIAEGSGESDAFWDDFFVNQLSKLFFFLLPFFAFMLHLLYLKQKRGYLEHFIFALHYHSFVYVVLSFYLLVSQFLSDYLLVNEVLITLCAASFLAYLVIAIKKVYQQSLIATLFKFMLLIISYAVVLILSATIFVAILL